MTAKEFLIHLPHSTIAAKCFGSEKNPPILALHGWLDNAASFDFLAPLLKDFYVVAIDLRGHGKSSHPAPGHYLHYIEYVGDIIAIADNFQWQTFSLLGHSLGAAIACLVAGTIPERISHLALLDALGLFSITPEDTPKHLRDVFHQYANLSKKRTPVYPTIEDAIQARMKVSSMSEKSVHALIERGLKQTENGYCWRTDTRLMLPSLLMLTEPQVEAFLHSITAPSCLIRPDRGWPFTEELFESRTKCIQNLTVHRIPGHHHVHMDDAGMVSSVLNVFFMSP